MADDLLIATISLNASDDSDFPFQWRVIDALSDEGDVDGGFIDVASEDEDEWARQADALLSAQGYSRTSKWQTNADGSLSGALVDRVA